MKMIEVKNVYPTLDDVMNLAEQELVLLRQSAGATFVVAQVDEFTAETELLKNNREFMAFLNKLGQDNDTIPLASLRTELGL